MSPEQIKRLREVEAKLADLFITEADPDKWDKERTERYKQKRDAAETAQLLARTQSLIDRPPTEESKDPNGFVEDQQEKMIRSAERRAEVAVKQALERAKRKDAAQG